MYRIVAMQSNNIMYSYKLSFNILSWTEAAAAVRRSIEGTYHDVVQDIVPMSNLVSPLNLKYWISKLSASFKSLKCLFFQFLTF